MNPPDDASAHLLHRMAHASGCIYLSDLRWSEEICRSALAALVEQLAPEDAQVQEWNDALTYLARAPAEPTAERARARLLDYLTSGKGGSDCKNERFWNRCPSDAD